MAVLLLAISATIKANDNDNLDVMFDSDDLEDDDILMMTTHDRNLRYRQHDNAHHPRNQKPKPKDGAFKKAPDTSSTLGYKHQEKEITRFGFALAFLLVVMPPVVFVCIYAPGECLLAIGISKILIGGILHYVHSQDPYHTEYPPHTSPSIYVIAGFVWILAGLGKNHAREMAREMEEEEGVTRRRKYGERRTKYAEEDARERRRRDREKRRKAKAKRNGGGFELMSLKRKPKKKRNARESDAEDEEELESLNSSFSEGGYHSSFSEADYHSSFSEKG